MASNEKVDDYGIQVIQKAARVPDTSRPTEYSLRTNIVETADVALVELDSSISANGNTQLKTSLYSPSGVAAGINSSGQVEVVLGGIVSAGNSSTVPLLANATFTGVSVDTLDYAMILVTVFSDVVSAANGLHVEVSSDGIIWRDTEAYMIAAGKEKTFSFQPNRRYIRIQYINGATNQTIFDLQTMLKRTNTKPSSHRVQNDIVDDDDAELVKAVITGKKVNGTYTDFRATNSGNFRVSLEELENNISVNSNSQLRTTLFTSAGVEFGLSTSPLNVSLPKLSYDIFGKLSTASPFKLFEYSSSYPLDTTRYWSTALTGSGTVVRNATKTQTELYTSTVSGDAAIIQSRRNIQYNKGNAQEILVIYRPSPIANRRERWGYFDANNGAFFEHDGTNARLVIRSNTSGVVVDTPIQRTAWTDKLDGTGASGKIIDWTKQTIFKIEIGWLSSRGVRFSCDIGGTFVIIYEYLISNTLLVPYFSTASLPIRFEVVNTGTTASAQTSSFTCCAVQSNGSSEQEGPIRTLSSSLGSTIAVSTTETVVSAVRLKSTFLNGSLQPINFSIMPSSGNTVCKYRLIYNPVLTGAAWTTPADGIFEYLTTPITTFTGGSPIVEGFFLLSNSNSIQAIVREVLSDMYIGRSITDTPDPLCITLQTASSTGTVNLVSLYKEFA